MKSAWSSIASIQALLTLAVLAVVCSTVHANIRLTVLPFRNLSQQTNSTDWRYLLSLLLKTQLAHIPQIRVLATDSIQFGPDEYLQFAYREAGEAGPIRSSPESFFVEAGRVLEVDLMVCGGYEHNGGKWTVKAWTIDVHTGRPSAVVSATSSDVFTAVCGARRRLLRQLLIPENGQESKLDRPPTESVAALELLRGALNDAHSGRPLSEAEQKLRKAVETDPLFALARAMLAEVLLREGVLSDAADQAARAIREQPDLACAHYILGTIYLERAVQTTDNNAEDRQSERLAETQFGEARQLAPHQPKLLLSLAQLYRLEDKKTEAMSLLQRANNLAYFDSRVHEEMAMLYIDSGDREQALHELETAERFDSERDYHSMVSLAQICEALDLTQKAVHYYEQLVAGAERLGINGSDLTAIKERLNDLKARLTPHFVTASPPESLTPEALDAAIRHRLGKVDAPLPKNPFAQTPEMVHWAHRIVGTNADEMTKAKLLFDAMTRRIDGNHRRDQRTAEEAFNEWTRPHTKFSCEDYTYLYVCLARDVGLRAFFAQVTKDDSGNPVLHACAGVFIAGRVVLVDPFLDWFGAPHQEYALLNDLEATALFWSQSEDLMTTEYSVKLAPDLPFVHFNLAWALADDGQTNRARGELQAGLSLPKKLWLAPAVEGQLDLYEGHAPEAVRQFKKCLALHPGCPELHYFAAEAYSATHDLSDAIKEFQTFLEQGDDPGMLAVARQQVSELDARLKHPGPATASPTSTAPAAGSGQRSKGTVRSS